MKTCRKWLVWLRAISCLWLATLNASALTNDLCAGAIHIPAGGPFPYLAQVIPDITDATNNSGYAPSCDGYVSRGVWFKFTPASNQVYRFSLSPVETLTTVPMTVMALYSATGPCSGLRELQCSDLDGCLFTAEITTPMNAGSLYYICVWKFGTAAPEPGAAAIQLRVSTPSFATTPPANDLCSGAQQIPTAGPFPWLAQPVDISAATITGDPASVCNLTNRSRSVWYRFRPPTNGVYNFSTCYDTATTVCDTLMAVYASTGDCAGLLMPPLACSNDKNSCDFRASITVPLSAATNYFIVVWENESEPPTLDMTTVQVRVSEIRPSMLSAEKLPGGFALQFSGIVASNYSIEASTNLQSWGAIGADLSGHPKGTNRFVDTNISTLMHRVYRVRMQ